MTQNYSFYTHLLLIPYSNSGGIQLTETITHFLYKRLLLELYVELRLEIKLYNNLPSVSSSQRSTM